MHRDNLPQTLAFSFGQDLRRDTHRTQTLTEKAKFLNPDNLLFDYLDCLRIQSEKTNFILLPND
jgi:hypothetical protein